MTNNTDALRIVAKLVGAANSARDVCEFGELCDAFIEEARAVIAASPQAPAAQQAAEFERGRQLGMQQERALWELSASSQEIERAAQQEPHEPVAWRFDGMEGTGAEPIWHYSEARPAVSAFAVQPLYVATQRAVKPLTDEQVYEDDGIMTANAQCGLTMWRLMPLVRAVERAHDIGKQEAP